MELVKYINQAKKCTKFHMFPDDDPVTPKTPGHGPETHIPPSLPASESVPHSTDELAARSDGPNPEVEMSAPSPSTEDGLQNLKISVQDKDCSHRPDPTPGTMSPPAPGASCSPSHSSFDWADSVSLPSESDN